MADTSVSLEEAQNDETKVVSLEKAYINREEKILDPDKLEESSLERLPKPTGWRLLILPYGYSLRICPCCRTFGL